MEHWEQQFEKIWEQAAHHRAIEQPGIPIPDDKELARAHFQSGYETGYLKGKQDTIQNN